ncbi:hypothetical protein MPER_10332 [Moniliophthora perniciosa FA553]|nr:hypothetical protein MPER_10332 [Moniliophthora perniciosa FA553]
MNRENELAIICLEPSVLPFFLVIGASYVFVLVISLLFCVKRAVAIRLRLQRISKSHNKIIGRGDVPNAVHEYMMQEYVRTSLIAFQSEPKDVVHEGWGRPGTRWDGVRFRQALLDSIPEIGSDEDELTPLHYYDSAIQLARIAHREPTEREFELGMEMAEAIKQILNECHLEMLEGSSTQLNGIPQEH